MDWAKKRITELLKTIAIDVKGNGSLSITNVQDIKGDAYFNLRKGKFRLGYEITIAKIEWKGEIRGEDKKAVASCKGTCAVQEFCEDTDEDDFEITNFKLQDDDDSDDKELDKEASKTMLSVMKKKGAPAIVEKLQLWVNEIHAMKDK